jgi:hypothetical protein
MLMHLQIQFSAIVDNRFVRCFSLYSLHFRYYRSSLQRMKFVRCFLANKQRLSIFVIHDYIEQFEIIVLFDVIYFLDNDDSFKNIVRIVSFNSFHFIVSFKNFIYLIYFCFFDIISSTIFNYSWNKIVIFIHFSWFLQSFILFSREFFFVYFFSFHLRSRI